MLRCYSKRFTWIVLWFAVWLPIGAAPTRNAQVESKQGMVASAHSLASQAGIEILKAGGNAIDAAVAAAFAIAVVEPNASGIGGEGMLVLYRADKKTAAAIDYRSTAPKTAHYSGSVPATGHAAAAVPGVVAGLTTALKLHGTMRLDQVLAPAIRFAEEGFIVSPTLAGIITESFEEILKHPPLAAVFCADGLPLEAGARLRNPDLAASLRKIADGGADVFYRGELAGKIAEEMKAHGGFISREDLASYQAGIKAPVRGSYRGFDLISAPPPVAGLTLIEILQILESFRFTGKPPLGPENVHLLAEAMKRGYADFTAHVADPAFVKVPVERLLSKEYARQRASEINPLAMTPRVRAGEFNPGSPSTTSLSVVDRKGNLVALTQTLSDFFGSKVIIAGTGILLNNEMKNFGSRGINAMEPGKRMRTTIAPTILLRKGKPYAALGTPGAARIISTMALILTHLVDHGMSIQEAIEAPRFHVRDSDKDMYVESRLPAPTLEALGKMGYTFQTLGDFDLFFGGAQGVMIDPKTKRRVGGADPRRDGAVIGY